MDEKLEIRTLNKDEALLVKAINPMLKPWIVVGWQLVVTAVLGLVGLLATQKWSTACSLVWGGLCVAVPAGIFARGLMSRATLLSVSSATAGFFVWELVKIGLTLAMLFSAPKVLQQLGQNLSWPAMLVGLVVAMKVYWLALLMKPRAR